MSGVRPQHELADKVMFNDTRNYYVAPSNERQSLESTPTGKYSQPFNVVCGRVQSVDSVPLDLHHTSTFISVINAALFHPIVHYHLISYH